MGQKRLRLRLRFWKSFTCGQVERRPDGFSLRRYSFSRRSTGAAQQGNAIAALEIGKVPPASPELGLNNRPSNPPSPKVINFPSARMLEARRINVRRLRAVVGKTFVQVPHQFARAPFHAAHPRIRLVAAADRVKITVQSKWAWSVQFQCVASPDFLHALAVRA